jgi:hypothetical protein
MVEAASLETRSVEELVSAWQAMVETVAKLPFDSAKRTRELRKGAPVWHELERRGEPALRHILPFLSHSVAGVRLYAAMICSPIAPDECRSVLLKLYDSEGGIVGVEATMLLMESDPSFLETMMSRKPQATMFDDEFLAKARKLLER